MKRRSKVSQTGLVSDAGRSAAQLRLSDTRGLVAPVPQKSVSVTLRLSGVWAVYWQRLRKSLEGLSDAEILRQGVAMRMATVALDGKGKRPQAFIRFHDEKGRLQEVDLEEYVGILKSEP